MSPPAFTRPTFVFVAQEGPLEAKAALLAASLRFVLGDAARLLCAIPGDEQKWGRVSHAFWNLLRDARVESVRIENPFGLRYPIGNKMAALAAVEDGPTVLLDSDILCVRRPALESFGSSLRVGAKPADLLTFEPEETVWPDIYRRQGLDPPGRRTLTTFSNRLSFPYFNSGVICAASGRRLGSSWISVAQDIDRDNQVRDKYPWLDQISFPVAAHKLGWNVTTLPECWNHPTRQRVIDTGSARDLIFSHYGSPDIIAREPLLAGRLSELLRRFPALLPLLQSAREWDMFLQDSSPRLSQHVDSTRNFLITGVPRSGTSLLCRLLHDQNDIIVINEPRRAVEAVKRESWNEYGMAVHQLYADLRRDILLGRPIENKLVSGKVATDTALANGTATYHPAV